MGIVHECEHVELGRRVAVKVLRDDFAKDHSRALERFRQEAIATASLAHPHIVQVSDFAVGPPTYLVMELLKGESLRSRLARSGALPASEARAVGIQVLAALEAAHAEGIVHRDIKPENIFLVETPAAPIYVKVLDFGIAKLLDPKGAPLTRTNEVLGSLAYMPPEQIQAGEITERADVYSVGVVLYEMLAGKKPFDAATPGELVAAVLRGARAAPIVGGPAALEAVAFRAMATLSSERFASVVEMRAALEASDTSRTARVDDVPIPRPGGHPSASSIETLPHVHDSTTIPRPLPLTATPRSTPTVDAPTLLEPAKRGSIVRSFGVIMMLAVLGAAVAWVTATYLGGR